MDTELKRGTVVGDYRLETEVCVAGIHRLWLAENRTSGEAVALKIPRRDRASETVLEECISRERQALDWIRTVGGHPNLMNLRESVSGDREAILVVDPVDGDKLGEVPGVNEVYFTLGDTDFVLISHLASRAMVEDLISEFEEIDEISRTSSTFVITTIKDEPNPLNDYELEELKAALLPDVS